MGIFISAAKTAECIVLSVIFSAAYILTFQKTLGILQSLGYSGKKLFGWAEKKNNAAFKRQLWLFLLGLFACAVLSLCFSFAGEWSAVIGAAAYIFFFIAYYFADKKIALRSPLTFTARIKRLYVVLFTLILILVYLAVTLLNFAAAVWQNNLFNALRYCPLSLFCLLVLPIAALSNCICKIYENPHNRAFIKKAKQKLAQNPSLTVVGITGSYGKTSVKNILAAFLSKKYRVLKTPRSHNTPLGLALTLNNEDLTNYDIFIAEMGARRVGDIAELCEFCPPDYSLITGICPQHLESFKSVENIIKAKGEILTATKKAAFIAPAAYDNFSARAGEIYNTDCVKDISADQTGTRFTLEIDGNSKRLFTKLLGAHSAENIGLAAYAAYKMGVDFKDICAAAEQLDYVEHRLQPIVKDGVYILDDGYNSNVKGAEAALNVLSTFGGKKIVVTPGLVELGVLEESENFALGQKLIPFDTVILVGDTLVAPVKAGYLSAGGDPKNLIMAPTLYAAQQQFAGKLKAGDAVLFLNDLPDIY